MNPRTLRTAQSGAISTPTVISLALAALLVLVGVWLSTGLLAADRWPIQWLQVDGQFQRISAEQVRSQIVSEAATGFFAVNLKAVKQAAETLPWVATAEIRKQWPDTIHVRILEHRPVARWGNTAMVSDRGQRFDVPGAGQLQGLPMLEAPEKQFETTVTRWQIFREQLRSIGADLDVVQLSERGAWDIRLNNGTVIRLGRDQVEERLNRLVAAYPTLKARAGARLPEVIDLRYSNGFTVKWPDEVPAEPEAPQALPDNPGLDSAVQKTNRHNTQPAAVQTALAWLFTEPGING